MGPCCCENVKVEQRKTARMNLNNEIEVMTRVLSDGSFSAREEMTKENGEQEVGACHAGKNQSRKSTERPEGHLQLTLRLLRILDGKIEAHRAEGEREKSENSENDEKNGVRQV